MQFDQSTRREFITLFGAVVAWSDAGHAQVSERMRRIGALLSSSADDPLSQTIVGAFSQGLQECGWALGRSVRIEYRWAAIDDDLMRRHATELVAFAPDVILAFGTVAARAIERESREVAIVFVNAADPVGVGLVKSWHACALHGWSFGPRKSAPDFLVPPRAAGRVARAQQGSGGAQWP